MPLFSRSSKTTATPAVKAGHPESCSPPPSNELNRILCRPEGYTFAHTHTHIYSHGKQRRSVHSTKPFIAERDSSLYRAAPTLIVGAHQHNQYEHSDRSLRILPLDFSYDIPTESKAGLLPNPAVNANTAFPITGTRQTKLYEYTGAAAASPIPNLLYVDSPALASKSQSRSDRQHRRRSISPGELECISDSGSEYDYKYDTVSTDGSSPRTPPLSTGRSASPASHSSGSASEDGVVWVRHHLERVQEYRHTVTAIKASKPLDSSKPKTRTWGVNSRFKSLAIKSELKLGIKIQVSILYLFNNTQALSRGVCLAVRPMSQLMACFPQIL